MTKSSALAIALIATVSVVSVPAAGAATATTCVYDSTARRVTLSVDAHGTAMLYVLRGRIEVAASGFNGPCGRATRLNTDLIQVLGTTVGSETVTIDQSTGRFAPGAEDETDASNEIEMTVDLKGTESSFTREHLEVRGVSGNDAISLGSAGIALNRDGDVDLTFTGDMSYYPGELDVTLAGGLGADTVSAQGGFGSGLAATGYRLLTIYGNRQDSYLSTDAANVLKGGNGQDRIDAGYWNANRIFGYGGNDTIMGSNRSDYLSGGIGNDQIYGDDGDDTIYGGAGDDFSLRGGSGTDVVYGQTGNDSLYLEGETGYYGDPPAAIQDYGACGGGAADHARIDIGDDHTVDCETISDG